MKQLIPTLTLLLLVSLLLSSCKKDKAEPIDQLPPATQEGKNTFGCLVNGEAFIPKGSMFSGPNTECYYQYIQNSLREGYVFQVSGSDKEDPNKIPTVRINADSVVLEENFTYQLNDLRTRGGASAEYAVVSNAHVAKYNTNLLTKGELKITRFDEEQQIVSGTFWFDAVNDKGEKVEVREGRFDMLYHR